MLNVALTTDFETWYESQSLKIQTLIDGRLERISEHQHFGDVKYLFDGLHELRWKNGLRLYFTININIDGKLIIILLGGNKNSQKKDIHKCRKLLKDIHEKEI